MTATVVRLQVQPAPLKAGPRGARVYDPSTLREAEALEVGPQGCRGLVEGQWVLDVHHVDHPQSRNRGDNALSLLTTFAQGELTRRYGLGDGQAGESLLVDGILPGGDLLLETDGAPVLLRAVVAIPPCVEFSRFCLGVPDLDGVDQALQDLSGGARGWYAEVVGAGVVRVGATVTTA